MPLIKKIAVFGNKYVLIEFGILNQFLDQLFFELKTVSYVIAHFERYMYYWQNRCNEKWRQKVIILINKAFWG